MTDRIHDSEAMNLLESIQDERDRYREKWLDEQQRNSLLRGMLAGRTAVFILALLFVGAYGVLSVKEAVEPDVAQRQLIHKLVGQLAERDAQLQECLEEQSGVGSVPQSRMETPHAP